MDSHLQSLTKCISENEKLRKIGQDYKTLVSAFTEVLTASVKNSFLEEKLDFRISFDLISTLT